MRTPRGFTLIEVLVAVTLLAIITMLIWQAMGTSVASKERFERQSEVLHGASLALSRMSRDLQTAVLYSTSDLLGVSPAGELRTRSVFIGEDVGDQDKLTFQTLSHIRYFEDAKESDQAEVTYFLETDPDGEGTFVLKKREASPPDDQPDQGGQVMQLLTGVRELNLRYYDSTRLEFVDSWDTTGIDYVNRLPRLVEIILSVQDPFDEERRHRLATYAWLEMSPGPNDF